MKARTLRRHLKESVKNLGRNGWMTFASVSAVTVTLLLVGVFFVIMMNLNRVATSIEEDVRIRVHIDVAATEEDRAVLEEQIRSISKVETVEFSSKEKELDNLVASLGEEGEIFNLFEQDNPLYDVFIVKTKDPNDTMTVATQIDEFNFTTKVKYGQGSVEKLFKVISVSRNVGIALIVGLLFTAMFLISNTIKITIIARRREIEIMRLVGATNAFIRWPFFLEGLMLGVLGSVIPITVVTFLYKKAYAYISPRLEGHFIQILELNPFMFQVAAIIVLMGACIGIWGSMMSVRKFLKI